MQTVDHVNGDHDFDRLRAVRDRKSWGPPNLFLSGVVPDSLRRRDGMRYVPGMTDWRVNLQSRLNGRLRTPMQWDDGPNEGSPRLTVQGVPAS